MNRQFFSWAFVASVVGVALIASAACGSVSPYAARVDGQRISEDTLVEELRSIAANEDYLQLVEERQPVRGTGQGTFDSAFTALALTRQIYYTLIATELQRRKLSVGESDLAAARALVIQQLSGEEVFDKFPVSYQDELVRRQAELDLLSVSVNELGPPDQAARTYYDNNQNDFAQACVSHILVADEAKANEINGKLAAGEDFGALATAESIDTESKPRGGDLGCDITPDTTFVPEFLNAVFTLPVGQVGGPMRTQFGYHLIKVTKREVAPYEQVADRARAKITDAGQEKVLTVLQEAVQKARIEVNPKYGSFRKTGGSPGVVPPESGATAPGGVGLDPAPVEPPPAEPAPSDPSPSDPAPSDPAPSDPAPSNPAPSNP
ncbi:MAG TPA: peptidylprolyl isomerase [Acidimicrobiales bacterium]|nr:peptidylprolyl isomerase [Acidimicrobiales bacterium]